MARRGHRTVGSKTPGYALQRFHVTPGDEGPAHPVGDLERELCGVVLGDARDVEHRQIERAQLARVDVDPERRAEMPR